MTSSLDRILRLRQLLEGVSQAELETIIADLRRLEDAAARQAELARQIRGSAITFLTSTSAVTQGWALQVADAEILEFSLAKLTAAAAAARLSLEAAREKLLARRIDRRQIEALVTAAAEAESHAIRRREQNQLDDWFQMKGANWKRRSR